MVSQVRPVITIEEFNRRIRNPENSDRNFELIAGEMVEKMVSNPRSSAVAAYMLGKLSVFVDEHELGHVTGADGGYVVSGGQYIPDAAFISKARCPVLPEDAYNPLPPDLAVEVLSPGNKEEDMRIKLSNYLAAESVVVIVDPGKRVEVHWPGTGVQVLGAGDTLEFGDLLPGFSMAVSDILSK